MMSSHTLEELVSIAADIRPGDDILIDTRHGAEWERVQYLSRREGVTRFVTRSAIVRRNDAAAVFLRREERAS